MGMIEFKLEISRWFLMLLIGANSTNYTHMFLEKYTHILLIGKEVAQKKNPTLN